MCCVFSPHHQVSPSHAPNLSIIPPRNFSFRTHLKFSRIEILRGNVEEAVRLNVREIEALQVPTCAFPSEIPASTK